MKVSWDAFLERQVLKFARGYDHRGEQGKDSKSFLHGLNETQFSEAYSTAATETYRGT